MKKIIALVLALIMTFSLAACGDAGGSITSFLKGDVTGEIGKSYNTKWFEFSVDSITTTGSYKGMDADEGYLFVDVVVTEKNTFDETIPMSSYDFYLDAEAFEEYEYAQDKWDDSMMPDEFELAADEEVSYHLIYMIPEDTADISFVYIEVDVEENIGATFTILHSLGA